MSKKHTITYDYFKGFLKDKDKAVNFYIDNYLDKLQSMFHYENLPDTIPEKELECLLMENGNCFVTKVNEKLYALDGVSGGELDEYSRPTLYTVSNPYLNISESYKIGIDGILVKNDYKETGLLPLIGKYAVLLTDSELTLNTAAILSRITFLISATDDNTKASAELFLKNILNGDYSIIGGSAFFDGVKMQSGNTSNTMYLTQLIEIVQYYKATFLNELGLQANYNMKRERLTSAEIATNVDVLFPFVDDMLNERQIAMEKINEMFDTNIKVDFSSVWKTTHEEAIKEIEYANTIEINNASQLEDKEIVETVETNETENEVDEQETETELEETETELEETETEKEETQEESEEKKDEN